MRSAHPRLSYSGCHLAMTISGMRSCVRLLLLVSVAWLPPGTATASKEPTLDEPFQQSFDNLPHIACVSLFHRQGRFGCGTESRETQTGSLEYFDSSLEKFPSYQNPYVLLVDEPDLTNSNIQTIVGNNKYGLLKGILVMNSTMDQDGSSQTPYYSPAPQSPQGYNTPSENIYYGTADYAWNANGDGLYLEDLFGLPIAFIPDIGLSAYLRAISLDSEKKSAIVAEFNYYMGVADMDSPTCLAWKDQGDDQWRPKCLPLGGASVWAVAGSPEADSSERRLEDADSSDQRPIVMLATSMDATSLFHDAVPAGNTAATNILTLLMAAKLLGSSVDDNTLDGLNKRILFGFFQGESYGFMGSRAFLRDVAYPGFQCDDGLTVPSVTNAKSMGYSELACLHPLRPSLEFQNLGEISGMIAVDQIGVLGTENTFYLHSDGSDFGGYLTNVFQSSITDQFYVYESDSEDGAIPPTPLTSLLQLSEGGVGGLVLTGYNDAFASSYYHSHRDNVYTQEMNLDAIASAATLLARSALAAAYDDGSFDDSDTAAQYATGLISDLSANDETLSALADCLYKNGHCNLLKKYERTEQANDKERTGIDLGSGSALGTPPNYYVGVYDVSHGQPFVKVGDDWFGSYVGEDYGKRKTDAFGMRPTLLEMALRGMLNDFLGRGSTIENDDGSSSAPSFKSCSTSKRCSGVSYCDKNGDKAVCTGGGECVCSRAHYHIALDEALEAAANNATGYYIVSENDGGVSPMYTEPYWSSSVGVRVYRDVGGHPGLMALASGLFLAGICAATVFLTKRKMRKEKLY